MIKLSSLFSEHAVLQREQAIPVWGWTEPNIVVKVEIAGKCAVGLANDHGKFLLRIPPLPAGGPCSLTVTAVESGESITVGDLMIGEVWLASGQSNMEMQLASCELDDDLAKADFEHIRMITPDRSALLGGRENFSSGWKVCTPVTASAFSAAAYFFAQRLHRELGVPIGIISSSWGGTIIESWTSRETLVKNPDLTAWVQRYELDSQSSAAWLEEEKEDPPDYPVDPGNQGFENSWHKSDFDDSAWEEMELPGAWQNRGFVYSGVFWFRKKITVPGEWVGKDLVLGIGAADKHDITYFNGSEVGRTGTGFEERFWNAEREYTVPASVNNSGECTIAIRVYSFVFGGGLIGPAESMKLYPAGNPDEAISLAGEWKFQIEHDFGVVVGVQASMGQDNPNSPYMLFDNHIAPMCPYALRGFIWYQGESNAGSHLAACRYQRQIKDLINDWRHCWGQGELTFIQVQLANFRQPCLYQHDSCWALLRESQNSAMQLDNSGVAVIIDVGDSEDIHPKDKKSVGYRLAQWALSRTYGQPIVPCGPVYESMQIEGDAIRIFFKYTGQGLTAVDGQELRTFHIAAASRKFVPAKAEIQGNTVLVRSDDVRKPEAVRYAWADNPAGCNLGNIDGLPASPFRTDSWTYPF